MKNGQYPMGSDRDNQITEFKSGNGVQPKKKKGKTEKDLE